MNILHITDFHFAEKGKDPSHIINAIIDSLRSTTISIDFIFFTGDLVYSGGDSAPYKKAYELLFDAFKKELHINPQNILLCPGNHDLDRSKISKAIKSYIDEEIKFSNEKLNSFYKEKNTVDFINTINPSKAFYNFIREIYYEDENIITDLYSIHFREYNGKKIGVVCLNTAWISSIYADDKGNLLIPTELLHEVKKQIRDCAQKIILIHHPLYFLKDFNLYDVESIIHSEFNLLFSGHVHKVSSLSRHNGTNGIFEHVSKASLSHRENIGCSLIQIDDIEENKIAVKEITYVEDSNECLLSSDMLYTIPCGVKKAEILAFRKKVYDKIAIEQENANNLLLLKNDESKNDFIELYNHPVLKKESESNLESKNTPTIGFEELITSNDNYLVLGKDKCGKTTLLRRLQIEYLMNFSRNNIIPFYIDAKDIESKVDDTFALENLIRAYYEINKNKTQDIVSSSNFILLIDNYSPNTGFATYLDEFIKQHPRIKYVICSEYNLARTVEIISLGNSVHEKIFFHELRRQEVVSYTEKRLSVNSKKDDIQQRIIQLCKQLELPLNYWTISLLLVIHNKSSDSYAKNLFTILDICIDEIFSKKQLLLSRSKISHDQLKKICSQLAKMLFQNHSATTYSATEPEILMYVENIISENDRIAISKEKIFEYLLACGIIKQKHNDNRYVFRLNGFFEYFLAYQMTKDTEFRKMILTDDSRFVAFKNQIEIYSGFKRDDIDFLEIVFEKVGEKLNPVFAKYNADKDSELLSKIQAKAELEEFCKRVSIKRTLSAIEKAKIEDDASELHFDSEVHLVPDVNVNIIDYELVEKYLSILARTFRSSDEISGSQDKIAQIFDYIVDGYCNLGFFVVEEFERLAKMEFASDEESDMQNFPEFELFSYISNFTPLICQVCLFDGIGHYNLERKIRSEIDKLISSGAHEEYKLFMLCFLLLDIDLEGNSQYINTLMDYIRMPILKYAIIIKLNYYLAFRGGNKKEFQQKLSNYIQKAKLNLDSTASIRDIHQQIQQKKKESLIKTISDQR